MTETMVIWRLPDWAAEVIREALESDVDDPIPAFDTHLRNRLQLALESIEEGEEK